MNPTPRRQALVLGASLLALPLLPALAQHDHHAQHKGHGDANAKAVVPQAIRVNLVDTPLVDQDGRALRLKSEAIGDRIVVIDFIYTNCTTVCPVVSAVTAQVQGKLGSRAGREVALLTLTVDPVRDTPARLKEYGRRHGAGPGWTWLTGPKPQVDEALKVFGAYTPNFVDHPPLVLVGDAKSGRWMRFFGFPNPDQVIAAVSELTAARNGKSG